MDPRSQNFFAESFCPEDSDGFQDIERCPFLRNINEPTNFSFSSFNFSVPVSGSINFAGKFSFTLLLFILLNISLSSRMERRVRSLKMNQILKWHLGFSMDG